jgi:hypothetical protein
MKRLALLFALLATPAFAQAPPDEPPAEEPRVQYKMITDIVIDDVRVGADIKGPMGHFGLEKRQSSFNPLIRPKPDFNAEMVQSVGQIR